MFSRNGVLVVPLGIDRLARQRQESRPPCEGPPSPRAVPFRGDGHASLFLGQSEPLTEGRAAQGSPDDARSCQSLETRFRGLPEEAFDQRGGNDIGSLGPRVVAHDESGQFAVRAAPGSHSFRPAAEWSSWSGRSGRRCRRGRSRAPRRSTVAVLRAGVPFPSSWRIPSGGSRAQRAFQGESPPLLQDLLPDGTEDSQIALLVHGLDGGGRMDPLVGVSRSMQVVCAAMSAVATIRPAMMVPRPSRVNGCFLARDASRRDTGPSHAPAGPNTPGVPGEERDAPESVASAQDERNRKRQRGGYRASGEEGHGFRGGDPRRCRSSS